jgi:hypothetical protein
MKRLIVFCLIVAACIGVSWGAYQAASPTEPALSHCVPSGALLYLQAKDFSALLAGWDESAGKQTWLKSSNYEVFSRSRLFLRLSDASKEFSSGAGLPADTNLLRQVAGTQSTLAIFDIGKLQFLYITRLPSANSMQTALWQTRSKFETRNAAGVDFFSRRDAESGREVAFAITGDYLILATREDLVAGTLQLIKGSGGHAIESEAWWSQSVSAAKDAGDLRMVLNLEKIVPSPYFRSYWVQQNITDLKQYSAAISDLTLSSKDYQEQRILLRKTPVPAEATQNAGLASVSEIVRLVPPQAGFYRAKANPTAEECLATLETKILAPHRGPAASEKLAPQVQIGSGETGSSSDLETRIDLPPTQPADSADNAAPLKAVLSKNPPSAIFNAQYTEKDKDGVFVRIHSAVALLGASDWNEADVRNALAEFVRPSFTTGKLGVNWQPNSGYFELDGLWSLCVNVSGKYLLVSDNAGLLAAMLSTVKQTNAQPPAVYVAGFDHSRERENFLTLTRLLDRSSGASGAGDTPHFFSKSIGSLSSTLAGVSSEKIVIRDAGGKVTQTVTYEWEH